MKEELQKFLRHKREFEKKLKKFIIDKENPLDVRWDIFIKSGLGVQEDGEFPGIDWSKHNYFDDFYIDRGSSKSVSSILESALDYFEEGGEEEFKEYCLNGFINSFRNEW